MAFNSNSQISYLVLNSLTSGSKYGLEIIESISKQTNGQYILKKPTLYSCLTRMEKKGWISSSYWSESELGGKRHYYSITALGKSTLQELEKEFENISFSDFSANLSENDEQAETVSEEKPVFLQQGNIFDMVKNEEKPQSESITETKSDILENQIDIFSFQNNQEEIEEELSVESEEEPEFIDGGIFITDHIETKEQEKIDRYQSMLEQQDLSPVTEEQEIETIKEEIFDDGKFLDEPKSLTASQEEQNQRLYDTSSELKKYRKRKSFSENQIEMSVVYQKEEDDELERERIRQLKESLLSTRQTNQQQIQQQADVINRQSTYTPQQSTVQTEKVDILNEEREQDDAIFITNPKLRDEEIPIQRKISPANIEVNIYDDNLPAPKRDSNLEPTYKDMMSKLFERKKEKPVTVKSAPQKQVEITQTNTASSFTDYNSLKRYYAGHGIDFKEYKKSSVNINHNTNFLNLINSCILLLVCGIGCAILYGIINGAGLLLNGTNFLFYTVPLAFLVYTIYSFVAFKMLPNKKAVLKYNDWHIWIILLLAVLIVFVINIACGMQVETMAKFITSLTVPIFGLLIALPFNYYITKYVYKKFSK